MNGIDYSLTEQGLVLRAARTGYFSHTVYRSPLHADLHVCLTDSNIFLVFTFQNNWYCTSKYVQYIRDLIPPTNLAVTPSSYIPRTHLKPHFSSASRKSYLSCMHAKPTRSFLSVGSLFRNTSLPGLQPSIVSRVA